MMFNHASGCRAHHCVMARHVTGHSADGCTLQTALGVSYGGKRCETPSECKIRYEVAHIHSLTVTTDQEHFRQRELRKKNKLVNSAESELRK
jgi:hypothetical protein